MVLALLQEIIKTVSRNTLDPNFHNSIFMGEKIMVLGIFSLETPGSKELRVLSNR